MIDPQTDCQTGITRLVAVCATGLVLGCAQPPTAVDRDFGQSTRRIQLEQSVHPHDAPPAYPPLVSDAVSGKAAIERYYKSYEAPPPSGNILNIGVGTPPMASGIR